MRKAEEKGGGAKKDVRIKRRNKNSWKWVTLVFCYVDNDGGDRSNWFKKNL